MSVPNLKRIALLVQKLLRGPKISRFGHITYARPLWGHFMIRTQYGSVVYVCAKFEAYISICSKVIRRSQNFDNRSRNPGDAH